MSNKIFDLNKSFDFNILKLGNPSLITNNNYFSKLTHGIKDTNLYLQLPKCLTKQGIIQGANKSHCELCYCINEKKVIEFLENLEKYCIQQIFNNREKWFYNSKNITIDDIEELMTPLIKTYKHGKNFLFKNLIKPDKLNIYDEDENKLHINDYNNSHEFVPLININGIKFSNKNLSIEIFLTQMLVLYPSDEFEKQILIKVDNNLEESKTLNIKNEKEDGENEREEDRREEDIGEGEEDQREDGDNEREEDHREERDNKQEDGVNEREDGVNEQEEDEREEREKESREESKEESREEREEEREEDGENEQEEVREKDGEKKREEDAKKKNDKKNLDNVNLSILDLDNLEVNETIEESPFEIKSREEIYLEVYKKAKRKAKEIRKNAIKAFLEAKNIKTKYNLDYLIESDSSDEEEELL